MADNVTLPGTGAAVRSDDVGGVQVQVVKVALGADGAEDTLIDSGQQTMANSLPVTLASDQSDVKITLDSEAVVLGAGSAAIGKLAANDGVDIGNVDVASIAAGTNLIGKVSIDQVTANANEVVVKSGTVTAVTAIINALPAGDNNIGNVDLASAIPAGTNNIGDVDVLSVVPGTGATNLGKAEDAGHTSGDVGVMALGVRNEDGDDFSGTDKDYLPVAVNAKGSVYTVVRSALPAGANAIGKLAANSGVDIGDVDVTSLPALAAGTNLIGKVSIDQVTANANEVVVKSALPAGTNAIGKLAANSGVDIGDVDILSIAAGDNNIGNVDIASIAAGTNIIGKVQPFSAMLEGGLTELVGINEQVDQNDYSGSVGVSLGGTYSGEILSVAFYATEDGTGAVQDSAGILYVLDADPSIASGDTAMSAAARVTVIGKIAIGAADWDTDANGGLAYICNQPIPFHALANLYFVWKHLDATSLNDAAGDDEQLEFNFWWKRES